MQLVDNQPVPIPKPPRLFKIKLDQDRRYYYYYLEDLAIFLRTTCLGGMTN